MLSKRDTKKRKYWLEYVDRNNQRIGYHVTGDKADMVIELLHIKQLGGFEIILKEIK